MNAGFYMLIVMLAVMVIFNGGNNSGLNPDAIRMDSDSQTLSAELTATLQNIYVYESTHKKKLTSSSWKSELRRDGAIVPTDRAYQWSLGETSNRSYVCIQLMYPESSYQQELLQQFTSDLLIEHTLSNSCGDINNVPTSELITPSITVFY